MTRAAVRTNIQSMSGIGEKVARGVKVSWEVQCYTLPEIFDKYWKIERPYKDVFIKIDVESYECKLVPSFYDWLKDEQYLPKMYISFHPQIQSCNDADMEGVKKFLMLYDHVRINGDREEFKVDGNVSPDEVRKMIGSQVVLHQTHHWPAGSGGG